MESGNNNSGDSGAGHRNYNSPSHFNKSKHTFDAGNEKVHHGLTKSDSVGGSSQLAGNKHCRDEEEAGLLKGIADDKEDGPEMLQEAEAVLLKAMEEDIRQFRQRIIGFTHQVFGLLEAGKSYFQEASTAYKDGILQLHSKIVEAWEEQMERLRNVDIIKEEICTHLREAYGVLEKLQVSVSSAGHRNGVTALSVDGS